MQRKITFQKWIDPLYIKKDENEEETSNDISHVLATSMGLVTVKLHGPLKSDLRFIAGHTNWDISAFDEDVLNRTPGVEILEIFSRYRFKVGIGHNFTDKQVARNIRKALCGPSLGLSKIKTVELKKAKIDLDTAGKPYIMYISPNADFYHSDELSDKKLLDYQEAVSLLGGKIITGGV